MKKLITIILGFVLFISSMPVIAFAGDTTLEGIERAESIDVKVSYQNATQRLTVYSVDIEWQDMNFIYKEAGTNVWKPDTHEYEEQTANAWESNTAEVTVTNHSNASVRVAVSYTGTGMTGVTGAVTNGIFSLESAEGKEVSAADTETATLTISGVPTDKDASNLKIGFITVSIE